ncbi:hypothetical protein N182_38005 [Sinorhizobium sp. GL2]|nr:hypothetical protein N182_38005 [Sinorhizobium sp. GL2]
MVDTTLLMLSGGLDSMTLAYQLKREGTNLAAIFLNHGRPPALMELDCAMKTAKALEIPLEVVNITTINDLLAKHAFNAGILKPFEPDELDCVTAISGFLIVVSIALYYGQLSGSASIALAITADDIAGRPGAPNALNNLAANAAMFSPGAPKIAIDQPFASLTKTDVVKRGASLAVPFDQSWSCWHGGEKHDGTCRGCTQRKNAFLAANVADTTSYLF